MNPPRPLAVVLVCLLSAGCGKPQTPPYGPISRFTGTSIPDPPMQGRPWTPPRTSLPTSLVAATMALFDSGMADPRGCEYREVEVRERNPVRTCGFVLPAAPGSPHRFVVNWDGVVRPAYFVGDEADFAADVRALARGLRYEPRPRPGPIRRSWFTHAAFNFSDRAPGGDRGDASPLKLAILLRLDRADLAEALFAAATDWRPGRDPKDQDVTPPILADGWWSVMWGRAGRAHESGDDVVALDAARRLDAFERKFLTIAAQLRVPRGESWELMARLDPARMPPREERPLALLLADQERRAREGPPPPAPPRGSEPKARVAALIRQFDQIAERQVTWPGSANPGSADIVTEVVAEGDAAVEPLLAALESDTRLTRSLSRPDNPPWEFSVHPVLDAVEWALARILRTPVEVRPEPQTRSGIASFDARRAKARELREFWSVNRSVPLPERWFRTLADDRAGVEEWTRAAGAIVGRASPGTSGRPVFTVDGKPVPPPSGQPEKPLLLGESLRKKRDPSVTDLLTRRALETTPGQGRSPELARVGFGWFLQTWDPQAALPVLRTLTRRVLAASAENGPEALDGFAPAVAAFTEFRYDAADFAAVDDFAIWVRGLRPRSNLGHIERDLAPLWRHAGNPRILTSARGMFTDKGSPWLPLSRLTELPGFGQGSIYTTPLIRLPSFREAVFADLADSTEIGVVMVKPPTQVGYELKNGGSGGFTSDGVEPEKIDSNAKIELRVCDVVAHHLGRLDGTPPFEVFWPRDRRDRAIAAIVDFLQKYGDRFVEAEMPEPFGDLEGRRARLVFPALGRPAKPDDVRRKLAVFSLDGLGDKARLVSMPPYPIRARWTALKDFPRLQHRGGTNYERVFDQDGWVWQAEEVGRGNERRRFFGFVGSGVVARVPAEEIEFPQSYFPGRPDPDESGVGIDAQLRVVSKLPPDLAAGLPQDAPIEVAVDLHNRRGEERAVPTEFVRKADDGRPVLRAGVELEAWFLPADEYAANPSARPSTALTATRADRFEPARSEGAAVLGPAASREACRLTLGEWFDLSKPGLYRFRASFQEASGVGHGRTADLVLAVGTGYR